MFLLIPTLLLAGASSAQITTTMLFLESNLGNEKFGFYGSVIGASNAHTTLAVSYDNGTDIEGLNLGENFKQTITISPDSVELNRNLASNTNADGSPNLEDGNNINIRCNAGSTPQLCTYSYGTELASEYQCATGGGQERTRYQTMTNAYSGRLSYSAGVETVTRSIVYKPYTPRSTPSWCSASDYTPTTGYAETYTMSPQTLGTYQLVITAGAEKLSSATQGASGSSLGVTPGASGSSILSGATPTASGVAGSVGAVGPMRTAAPILAGLGAAAAMFL
jgi:hypothetical protein